MAQTIKPLDLTVEQKQVITEYLKTFNTFMNFQYEDDPFDVIKRAEYAVHCNIMKQHMKDMYVKIPQIVKNEKLVPKSNYPYF